MARRPGAGGREGEVVVTPPAAVRRRRELRFVALFVVAALPVALVLALILGPLVAGGYVIAQTAFLTYGLRRRQVPTLRLSADGLSYEPGRFQLRCGWDAVVDVETVDLPTGRVEAFRLDGAHLHWAADPAVRREVAQRDWGSVVPVGDFEPEWRAGRIGDCARRWAPHLLERGTG